MRLFAIQHTISNYMPQRVSGGKLVFNNRNARWTYTNEYKYIQIYANIYKLYVYYSCVCRTCATHTHTHAHRPPCCWRFLLELLVALVAHIVKPPSIPLMPVLPPFLAAVVRHLFCSVNTYSCIHTFSHTFAHTHTHTHGQTIWVMKSVAQRMPHQRCRL